MTTIIGSLPYSLTNGTTADAAQVQADFDQIVNSVNANAAGNGNNTDITQLSALSTPLTPTQGGSSLYVGGTSTGSANAQVVASPSPTGFSLTAGRSILFISGFNNSAATTLNVASTGVKNLFKPSSSGPTACTGGELRTNQYALATYDGTQFQLIAAGSGSAFLSSLASLSFVAGDTIYASGTDVAAKLAVGAPGLLMAVSSSSVPSWSALPPTYISGLVTSRASATTITVQPGGASNNDGGSSFIMTLPTAFTKSLTNPWVLGTGNAGLTSAVAPNTWYHIFLIRRTSDGLGDILFDTSPTAPTMPSGWGAHRRIWSFRTNGSSQITPYLQAGNRCFWETPVYDVNLTTAGTAASRTLTVPTGVVVGAHVFAGMTYAVAGAQAGLLSPLALSDIAPAVAGPFNMNVIATASGTALNMSVMTIDTNTSAQIRSRMTDNSANTGLRIMTLGWVDYRGET